MLLILQDGRSIVVRVFTLQVRKENESRADFPPFLFPSLFLVQGTLSGYDQKSNVILSNSKERIYSMDEGVEEVPLGLYLVKGDMMLVAFLLQPRGERLIILYGQRVNR